MEAGGILGGWVDSCGALNQRAVNKEHQNGAAAMTTDQIASLPRADKNALISARILALVAQGMEPGAALDAVCGAGTFDRMAGDLYDRLRAKS